MAKNIPYTITLINLKRRGNPQPSTNKFICQILKVQDIFRETAGSFDNFVKMGSSGEEIKVAVRVRKLLDRENGSNIQWKTQGQNEIKSLKDPSKK